MVETVLRGLPAGATLILQVGDREKFISRQMVGVPEATEGVNEHLLDGQQRLTALWRSFHDLYEDRTYFVRLAPDEEHDNTLVPRVQAQARWERDGNRYPLWADQPAEVHTRGLIPLRLLRPGDLAQEIPTWCESATKGDYRAALGLIQLVTALRESVTTYNVPYLLLPVTTPRDVALDVFIKLNTSSVKLTAFDIVVAQVEAATGQSLHQLVSDLIGRVPRLPDYIAAEDLILSTAALRENRPPTQKSFQLIDYDRLVDEWDQLVAGAAFLVEWLEGERIFDASRLPTVAILPVIAALRHSFPSAPDAKGNARSIIRKYLWRSLLTDRYEIAAATKALQDHRGLSAVLQGELEPEGVPVFRYDLHPLPTHEELLRAGWPRTRDVLARGILAISIKAGAVDFADAEPATAANVSRREYHHLFPDVLLTGKEGGQLSSSRSYRALNCALITWNTNRTIAAKEPIAYLQERTDASKLGEEEVRRRLHSHLVPFDALNVGGYKDLPEKERVGRIRVDYDRFLDARAEVMQSPIKALTDGRSWP